MLGQGVIPVLLLTVHGHVRSIGGSRCRGWGGPWLPVLPEGSTCPLDEAEVRRGGRALLMTSRGLGRGRKMPPEAPISPETFPQGSGGMEFVVHAASDCHAISAFGASVLLGPLWWGFSDRAGCRILPSVGYPSILIPDKLAPFPPEGRRGFSPLFQTHSLISFPKELQTLKLLQSSLIQSKSALD
jgi:hypothetical protein